MLKTAKILLSLIVILEVIQIGTLQGATKKKPWPEINLSTLPSVVGMANSWVFEINQRSPVYLSDLDRMYVTFGYGYGTNKNDLQTPASIATQRYGYDFYNKINYTINEFHLNAYSNFSKKTSGSFWINYGQDRDKITGEPFLVSVPSRLDFKTAFSWHFSERLTLGVSGAISNYPRSYIFALQKSGTGPTEPQVDLPAGDGENLVGETDLLYRTKNNLDIILGGLFQTLHTKYELPDPPRNPDGSVPPFKDTSIVKEYIYSGAPKIMVKKTYPSGSYIRVGGLYYFNLFDYQYEGKKQYAYPSIEVPSFSAQSFNSLLPKWKLFTDGSKVLGNKSVLYTSLELASYPDSLTKSETDFVPIKLSLANNENLFSGALDAEFTSMLTPIFSAMAGIEIRYVDIGNTTSGSEQDIANTPIDNNSVYAKLRIGTTTRFYKNLWWSVRLSDIRLYSSNQLGSAILFENKNSIETEVLFLGL